ENRFSSLADMAPVLIWMADAEGNYTFLNRPWLEFTGQTLEHELGEGWMSGIHPEDRERCREVFQSCLAERKAFSMEYRLRRAHGEYAWILDRGVPRYTRENEF